MASRPRSTRLRRTLLAALVTASVAVPVSGAAVPAPAPAALGPLRAATPAALDARYAAERTGIPRPRPRTSAGGTPEVGRAGRHPRTRHAPARKGRRRR
ncbi:hypothetical protein [Streptomyces sp. NPDC048638]|uniref:hypothetical protein n=1 Tax=Streptomyces sp. NPDC048638 TaxID=3365580 RepID=UPI003724BDBF